MLIGHQKQFKYLKRLAKLDKLPHALMFSGQEKLGKKTLALEFISSTFSADIEKNQHSDFFLLEPAKSEIQISQIRELIWRLSLKPSSAPFKAAIIDKAHLMNQQAQSALLKTLEEPKGQALLILITEHPEALFATIISRLQQMKFYQVSESEITNYLEESKIKQELIKKIVKICQGKPGLAIDFAKDPKKIKEREDLLSDLDLLIDSDLATRFQYVEKIAKAPQLREILNIWLFHLRENLIFSLNSLEMNFKQGMRNVSQIKRQANILEKLQNLNFLLFRTKANPRLALEILMTDF